MQGRTFTNVNVFAVRDGGCEQLLGSGLDARELVDFQDWWCYTKPFGSDVKIVVREDSQTITSFSTTGTEPLLAPEADYPDAFIIG